MSTKRNVPSSRKKTKRPGNHPAPARSGGDAPFDPLALFEALGSGIATLSFRHRQTVFRQGEAADALYYVDKGRVGLTVTSAEGKQRIIAVLDRGQFFWGGLPGGSDRSDIHRRNDVKRHSHPRPARQDDRAP